MSVTPDHFLDKITRLDTTTRQYYPNSSKVYVQGSRPDLRVPMREIALTDTETANGKEPNAPIRGYDSSGSDSDPAPRIDFRAGWPQI